MIACGELGELNQVSDTHLIQNETHQKKIIPYSAFFSGFAGHRIYKYNE